MFHISLRASTCTLGASVFCVACCVKKRRSLRWRRTHKIAGVYLGTLLLGGLQLESDLGWIEDGGCRFRGTLGFVWDCWTREEEQETGCRGCCIVVRWVVNAVGVRKRSEGRDRKSVV